MATITGFTHLVPPTYSAIMSALVNHGPLSITIDASQGIQTYGGGVYACKKTPSVDHAVLLVGYDSHIFEI